jgi:hypothetical protein
MSDEFRRMIKKVMRAQIPLILALLAAPLLVSATEVEEYFPITVCASWTYHISKERATTVGEKIVEERIKGWSVERFVKPSDEISYPAPVYILSQDISEENHATGRKTDVSIESHVSAEPHQVLLHGQLIRGASRIESKLTRFEPPVAMLKLPIPAPGEPFPSVMRSHGLTVDSRPYERAEETLKTPVGIQMFADFLTWTCHGGTSGQANRNNYGGFSCGSLVVCTGCRACEAGSGN